MGASKPPRPQKRVWKKVRDTILVFNKDQKTKISVIQFLLSQHQL